MQDVIPFGPRAPYRPTPVPHQPVTRPSVRLVMADGGCRISARLTAPRRAERDTDSAFNLLRTVLDLPH